jgi:hypothetical protein
VFPETQEIYSAEAVCAYSSAERAFQHNDVLAIDAMGKEAWRVRKLRPASSARGVGSLEPPMKVFYVKDAQSKERGTRGIGTRNQRHRNEEPEA